MSSLVSNSPNVDGVAEEEEPLNDRGGALESESRYAIWSGGCCALRTTALLLEGANASDVEAVSASKAAVAAAVNIMVSLLRGSKERLVVGLLLGSNEEGRSWLHAEYHTPTKYLKVCMIDLLLRR